MNEVFSLARQISYFISIQNLMKINYQNFSAFQKSLNKKLSDHLYHIYCLDLNPQQINANIVL